MDADKQAHYASCAQAEGVSLPVARRLLAVFLEARTPSVAQRGRFTQATAQRSTRLLAVREAASPPPVDQAAADETFVGHKPARLVARQDGRRAAEGRGALRGGPGRWGRPRRRPPWGPLPGRTPGRSPPPRWRP